MISMKVIKITKITPLYFFLFLILSPSPLLSQVFQLVKPDETHTQLLLNEENINVWLSSLPEKVSIIGIIGSYHSGKSNLQNKLFFLDDEDERFSLGHSVEPKTQGIWGRRVNSVNSDSDHAIIVLDTEGFYASDVEEAYDAKIFAVTTLLSSYLIYNSIRIIEQTSIDYLELLVRRAQLFALKTEFSDNPIEDGSDFDKLFTFPPLMWVVENFFQDLVGKTPTQWLNQLLKETHRRDDGDSKLSLLSLFPSIKCETLSIPTADKKKLLNLENVPNSELNPDYTREMETLRHEILSSVQPKMKGSHYLSGPEVATLLRILVKAANENGLLPIPSVWKTFVVLQESNSASDCLSIYNENMESILKEKPPRSVDRFNEHHNAVKINVKSTYRKLLLGLNDVYERGLIRLEESLEKSYKLLLMTLFQNIENHCDQICDQISQDSLLKIKEVVLPSPTKVLSEFHQNLLNKALLEFQTNLTDYKNTSPFSTSKNMLTQKLESTFNRQLVDNNVKMEESLNRILSDSKKKFLESMSSFANTALSISEENEAISKASETSNAFFQQKTQFASQENSYPVYQNQQKTNLLTLSNKARDSNYKLVDELCRKELSALALSFTREINAISLPLELEDLNRMISQASNTLRDSYHNALQKFVKHPAYLKTKDSMEKLISDQIEIKDKENTAQVLVICQKAVIRTEQRLSRIVKDYYFRFFFIIQAQKIAEEEFGEVVSSPKLRQKAIAHYIANDLYKFTNQIPDTLSYIVTLLIILLTTGVILFAACFLQTKKPPIKNPLVPTKKIF